MLRALGWSLALGGLPVAQAAVAPEQFLLEQVRLGEASYRDTLVQESLHRLELIAPDHPQLLAAKVRLALRQDDIQQAQRQLDKLAQIAPDSAAYRQANNALLLSSSAGRQQLQQARLLAAAGRLAAAQHAYQALFGQDFPTLDLAVEYWRLAARFPDQQTQAINALQALNQRYPANANLQAVLVDLLFDNQQFAEGMKLLQQLIAEPETRLQASERWLAHIKAMPIGDASLAQLQQLAKLGDDSMLPQVEALLQQQQSLLANPAFRARGRGLDLVARGRGAAAIPLLRQARKAYPNDVAIIGGLAEAYSQTNQRRRAISLFEQAVQLADPDDDNRNKWQNLLASNRYWLLIQQGDTALQQLQLTQAQQYYQQATYLNNTDSFGWLGLGKVAMAHHEYAQAERHFRQALTRDALNSSALLGLFELYRQQSLVRAEQFLAQLSRGQRRVLGDNEPRLRSELLQQQATPLEQAQQWHAAVEHLQQARRFTPDDVWLSYRLANALRQAHRPAAADQVFTELMARLPDDPQQHYAHALYLSSTNRGAAALAQLATLPKARWDQDIRDLAARLEQDQRLARAQRLREQGNNEAARALLAAQPPGTRLELVLADWALEDDRPAVALAGYRQVLQQDPDNGDARLGEIEALLATQQWAAARRKLRDLPVTEPSQTPDFNRQRRIANAWAAVGELALAQQLFAEQQSQMVQQAPSPTAALWWRDAARLARQRQQPQQALDDYRQAMQLGGLSEAPAESNDDFTRLTRIELTDDWLATSIRSDAADLYRQYDTTVTFNQDYQRSSGSGGYSDLTAHVSMLQLDTPLWNGQAFMRTDVVHMDAGRFSQGVYEESFATCQDGVCNADHHQTAAGISLGMGWQNEQWQGDIGTTPMGFAVTDWVGSLSYNDDWRDIGWELGVSRRPITSSLLSFSGTEDPVTKQVWGGVRVTQLELSGSYDQGEAHGVWGNLDLGVLTGKNVADNQRYRLMGGYYYKLINEDHRRFSLGLNSMWWQYQKDLSGYTLGQGGYYSPQRYLSLALPVSYRQRTDNWSWDLSGSASWSRAVTQDQRPYPLPGLLDAKHFSNGFNNDVEAGDSSSGFGYTLNAVVERRLTSHWFIGAAMDIQQAKDYTPSHGLLYVRYSFGGWQGDLDMPPRPLIPYGDF